MKTIPAGLASHIAGDLTTLAYGLKITRTDGVVYAFTSHDKDATISSVDYLASPGLDVTSIVTAANMAVGNLELTTLHDGTVFTTADVLGGVWRNAAFIIFRYNWDDISDGIDTLLAGTLGEVELRRNTVKAELRDLRQYLQLSVGEASSKTCRYRLGDSRCGIDLGSPNDWTVTGTITSVTSNQVFSDTSRSEADGWFDEGEFTWVSGDNAGLSQKVKTYALAGSPASGQFTLALPMLGAVQVGDTYTVHAGCKKRLEEDCRDKFDNVINFGGEPHRPGIDALTKGVEVGV